MRVVTNLDLGKLQLQNALVHPLATAPATPGTGQIYFDTALVGLRVWDGTAWTLKATDSALLNGQNAAYYLSRANHTGTQLAATISDLATTVQAYRLDQFATPNVDLSLGSHKLINVADPTNPQDAATMGWVQTQVTNAAAGIDAKPSVRAATTANTTLSGTQTIDGVALVAGDRVLVKNQTTASANGVYVVGAGAWARAADADANNELTPGAFWYVEEGTTNGKTQWRIENTGTITVGTTAITINQFGGAATAYTAGNGLALNANAFSVVAAAGGGISVAAGGVSVDTTIVARKYSVTIGDATNSTYTITHNLGTQDVHVSVRDTGTNALVIADVVAASVNTVTVTFGFVPALNSYRVTVIA